MGASSASAWALAEAFAADRKLADQLVEAGVVGVGTDERPHSGDRGLVARGRAADAAGPYAQGAVPQERDSGAEGGVPRERFRAGVRAAVPFALAGLVLSASFGVLARQAGLPDVAAIAMSLVVFAGSAQFAAVAIIGAGGSLGAALLAAALMNSRFLAMGIALAPSLPGGALSRAAQGQAVVDASWAMALRPDGSFDRHFLFGATAPQYLTWALGTVIGVLGGGVIGNPGRLGLDAVFPAFFLALLMTEAKHPDSRGVAIAGAAISLALTPFTPAGVPILAASVAALWGLRRAPSS